MSNEKIEAFWENATADDVAKIANTRKSIQARFRDEDNEDWVDCLLAGWKLSRHLPGARWIDADGAMWNHCQVYREPSWYANKPDPGPGFRLLGKFPDEPKLATDEAWNHSEGKWQQVRNDNGIQEHQAWYRRRIEPVEPKHYVLRVGDTVETPNGQRVQVISRSETQSFWALTAGDKLTLPNGQTITITAKGFEVTQ